jgi:hypothetical protein
MFWKSKRQDIKSHTFFQIRNSRDDCLAERMKSIKSMDLMQNGRFGLRNPSGNSGSDSGNRSRDRIARPLVMMLVMGWLPLALTACSTVQYTHDTAPRMVAVGNDIPFYSHGPAQGNGPDRKLTEGDEVLVLRKEFGFSFVELSDGKQGYVANESLVTAPPEPSPTPEPKVMPVISPEAPPEETNTPFDPPAFRY